MKIGLLFTLLSVVILSNYVHAEEEFQLKKGAFPYMAFIYYSDESVVDVTGNRFLRGAVLIRPDWLVTSAIQISSNDEEVRFPRKTLLARTGATTIDKTFTLNEDEGEQEREVIQIVRPSNHSATQWWQADITLMKTLLPFKINTVVSPATLHPRPESIAQSCSILVYSKRYGKIPENRILMELPVKILTPSIQTCGIHFYDDTMICASDLDDNSTIFDANFCQGNNGGPLICEGKIMGLQTYIDNNCKSPHLYQLLFVWNKFIFCGTEDKCGEEECANRCVVTNKDSGASTIQWTTDWIEVTTTTITDTTIDLVEDTPKSSVKHTKEKIEKINTTEPTTNTKPVTRTTLSLTSEITRISEIIPTTSDETDKISWPKKTVEDDEKHVEKSVDPNIESLQQYVTEINKKNQPPVVRSAGGRIMIVTQTFFISCILASFV